MIKCKRDRYIYVKYALSQSSMYRPSNRGRGRRFSFSFTLMSRQWTRTRDKIGLLFALKLNFDRCTTRTTFWYLLEFSFFFCFFHSQVIRFTLCLFPWYDFFFPHLFYCCSMDVLSKTCAYFNFQHTNFL